MSSFVVLSMVCFSPSIEQRKQAYNCNVYDVGVVHNEQMNHLCVYRRLLTQRLHGKAADP